MKNRDGGETDPCVNTAAHKRPNWCAWCGQPKPVRWKKTRDYSVGFHEKCWTLYEESAERCGLSQRSTVRLGLVPHVHGPARKR